MQSTDHLKLPYLIASQAQKHVTHNEALRMLDAIVQLTVLNRTNTVPPPAPQNGDRYIIAQNATGDWENKQGQIAAFQDDAWLYYPPNKGWCTWIVDETALNIWDGNDWIGIGSAAAPSFNPVNGDMLGINATADSQNRLALASSASLFNHEGDNHFLKINKAAASDTASIIFQSAFSGRAEFGTTGDDDFHMKVSPDGVVWHEGIVIDKSSGAVTMPNTPLGGVDVSVVVLTSGSGTYVPAPHITSIKVTCIGGGGGGAGAYITDSTTYCSAGGGGAGAVCIKYIANTALAATYSYSVGGGGSGGTAPTSAPSGSRNGNSGGFTNFSDGAGLSLTANGGFGAVEDTPTAGASEFIGGSGGVATGGDINLNGSKGFGGVTNGPNAAQNGVGNGASTIMGVGGAVNNGNGSSGTGYGAGGAGAGMIAGFAAALNRNGGDGAPGTIIIEEFS